MHEVSRRRLLIGGAAGAGAVLASTALAEPASATAKDVPAAGDLALWYDSGAGEEWLRALPIGNGRLGAMVFGNVGSERLALNEDTVWAGGPYDSDNRLGAAALPEIRRLIFADQWLEAQTLINQTMLGKPVGQMAYQPVGDLRLSFDHGTEATEFHRQLDLTTATA